ncbi:hypothetical protein D6810_02700 [Candidatus Dojkabacteria bacterium]|uniref:Mannosyl-glycoprotein endo-beta-N-acetylglucosamidase-like domain-containing protein n=1 Tax=Candidatus Dojkabacteria bacterium TaxID=2099670 RepID=A0A3M0Z080_9BACT|nr:MAG: hypothetical protein D6810_02700 [Candidatus Dojkabacteria bacterium]
MTAVKFNIFQFIFAIVKIVKLSPNKRHLAKMLLIHLSPFAFGLLFSLFFGYTFFSTEGYTDIKFTPNISKKDNKINMFSQSMIDKYKNVLYKEKKEERIRKVLDEQIDRVEKFFSRYNGGSVMKGYGRIIVERAYACGGDYRILVGIAGIESGLGRVPYKLYNPFGYLDNVQYESWEHALTVLSCAISKRFIAPCKGDLGCIIQRYGGPDTDREKWIRNVSWFMSQV